MLRSVGGAGACPSGPQVAHSDLDGPFFQQQMTFQSSAASAELYHRVPAAPPPFRGRRGHRLSPRLLLLGALLVLWTGQLTEASRVVPATTTTALSGTSSTFVVRPPIFGNTVFPLIEDARIVFLRLVLWARSETIMTSVGKTHVLDCPGRGPYPTAILVHGVCSCAHDYHPVISRLQKLCKRVLVIDLPGHGRSEIPDGEPQESWLTDSLCECLDQLLPDGEKALLFGNSLGGLVAIKAALLCPDKFAGLILASPAGAPVTAAQMEGLKDIFRLFTHQAGVAFMSRVTAFPQRIPSPLMHIMAWACRVRVSSPNIHRIMTKASSSHMLTARHLSRLKVPAMLIWGRHERIFPRDSLEFFRRHLPKDVEINEDEDFGHVPFLDDPDRLCEIVHEFMVRTCPRAPARAA